MRDQSIVRKTIDRDHSCQRCGSTVDLICHHIHALADGGADDLTNTIALCSTCHDGWHRHCEGWITWSTFLASDGKPTISTHSDRVRAALCAAKARGVRLGNPNGANALRRAQKGNTAAIQTVRAGADQRAQDIAPIVAAIRATGITTLKGIARELDQRNIKTARGGSWTATSVSNLLARI